jgi:hypothetical protein
MLGKIPPSMETPFAVNGRRIYLLHNPKCAGTALKKFLRVSRGRTSHLQPRHVFRRAEWEANLFVLAVRNPVARFASSYRYHVLSGYGGKLFKRHGEALKNMTPESYWAFMEQYPEFLGLQGKWACYPSATKPKVDLVLRVEDSADWPRQLREFGVEIEGSEVPRENVTTDEISDPLEGLGLDGDRSRELRRRIEADWAEDYEQFGY